MDESPLVLDEPIHTWFGLSYASYFVIPRTVLQSMPDAWQQRFIDLIEETETHLGDWSPDWPACYHVTIRGPGGRFLSDPLANYERGRRRLEPVPYQTEPGPCDGCRFASGPHLHLPSGRVCAPPLTDCPVIDCTRPPGHTHESEGPASAQTEEQQHG